MNTRLRVKIANPSPSEAHLFREALASRNIAPLRRAPLAELQVNLGRLCNQTCTHCHVDAGPNRTEVMKWEVMEKILAWARANDITRADITGGAPELNPNFRKFADGFIAMGATVTSRCNLTVLWEPRQEDLAEWYAVRKVRLICSLPCYTEDNVDAQRGRGVFDKSIRALQLLNKKGYGSDAELPLDLVYNPNGATLPPPQQALENDYKLRLREDFGIRFNRLLALTNLPVNRFAHYLKRNGQYEEYMSLLIENFNPGTVDGLMCRHLLSVDYLGKIYDCDFNQMMDIAAPLNGNRQPYLWDVPSRDELENNPIAIGAHCLGCTAGAGSSCGGSLA